MQRLLIIIIAALGPTATACVASAQGRLGGGEPTAMPATDDAPPPAAHGDDGPAGDEDEHWFTGDDYLVSAKPYEGRPRLFIKMGKMMTPPAEGTKSEARFLLASGKEMWTAHYWRSRIATDGDVSLGAMVFCPQGGGRPPDSKAHARRRTWLLGAITDMSDRYKGVVAVGHRDCEVRALRIPIR
jgi:hypothetical protein